MAWYSNRCNDNYNDVNIPMDTLNLDIANEHDNYKHTGQAVHSLAYAYYNNTNDRQVVSKCSPRVYVILER